MNTIAKVTATQEADDALDRMVKAVNEGFTGGKVVLRRSGPASFSESGGEERGYRPNVV